VLKSLAQMGHRKLVIVVGADSTAAAATASGASFRPVPRVPPATATPALLRKFLRFSPTPSLLLLSSDIKILLNVLLRWDIRGYFKPDKNLEYYSVHWIQLHANPGKTKVAYLTIFLASSLSLTHCIMQVIS
jgi:hypothetical protein